jgi:hypothetical protein
MENEATLGTGQVDIPAIIITTNKAKLKHFYLEDESPIYCLQVPKSKAYL